MPKDTTPGKPTTRRYSPDEKAAAVRMVRTLRAELGTEHGTVQRVAQQVGPQAAGQRARGAGVADVARVPSLRSGSTTLRRWWGRRATLP